MFEKMVNKVKNSLVVKFLLKKCPEETDKYILGIQIIVVILLLVIKHFCNNYNYNNINKRRRSTVFIFYNSNLIEQI